MPSRRLPLAALVLTVFGLVAGVFVAPPAGASSILLCQGFTQCEANGYSSFGYGPTNYQKMWWRMYAGHNCTNYVSYRMISRGMSATRPWSGSGDARNWGVVFSDKVDQTPNIGSIAWWSSNHVAYVQKIVDANTIIISEDHYGGNFDWRRIVRTGGGWPTGFIHLNDEQLVATAAPRIRIDPKVGIATAGSRGMWANSPTSFAYKWYADGVVIPGATAAQFTPTPDQFGKQLTVKVIARKVNYLTGAATSLPTIATLPGDLVPGTAPTLSGTAKVDSLLTATNGTWAPEPSSTTYTWRADGVDIPGASASTFKVGPDQLGKKITVVTTALLHGYADSPQESPPTDVVVPAKFAVTSNPRISGTPRPGQTLRADIGAVTPAASRTTVTWLRDGVPIVGANKATYVPATADIGHVLGAKVRYARPGYTTLASTVTMAAPVRVKPQFNVHSMTDGHLTVAVTAPGLDRVYGKVRMANAQGFWVEQALVGGRTTFAPKWLPAHATRTLTFSIPATRTTEARTVTLVVTIK
ncbi:MAG: CHAP domain-containing protein [Catenulispora sp.]